MTALTLLSALVLFGFIALCVNKHGLQPSYSAYAKYWWARNVQNLNGWQVATTLAAFLLVPPMIEKGVGNPYQFLGFFTPIYLIAVAFTPRWEESKKEHTIHTVAAGICALYAFLWLCIIMKIWYIVLFALAIVAILGYATKSLKSSLTLWLEMVMFLSTYIALIFY